MRTTLYLAALGLVASTGAQAVTVTFGGTPVANEGLVTSVVGPQTERFDTPGPAYGACGTPSNGTIFQGIDTNFGFFDLRNDELANRRRAPTGDTSCYFIVNDEFTFGGYVDFQFGQGDPTPNTYVGFYWGSPDEYNTVQLLDFNLNPITIAGFGDTLTGDEATAAAGLQPYESLFINFAFDTAVEDFLYLRIGSVNWAFELDNLAFSSDPISGPQELRPLSLLTAARIGPGPLQVPAPGMALAFGGLAGLMALARRRRA